MNNVNSISTSQRLLLYMFTFVFRNCNSGKAKKLAAFPVSLCIYSLLEEPFNLQEFWMTHVADTVP